MDLFRMAEEAQMEKPDDPELPLYFPTGVLSMEHAKDLPGLSPMPGRRDVVEEGSESASESMSQQHTIESLMVKVNTCLFETPIEPEKTEVTSKFHFTNLQHLNRVPSHLINTAKTPLTKPTGPLHPKFYKGMQASVYFEKSGFDLDELLNYGVYIHDGATSIVYEVVESSDIRLKEEKHKQLITPLLDPSKDTHRKSHFLSKDLAEKVANGSFESDDDDVSNA